MDKENENIPVVDENEKISKTGFFDKIKIALRNNRLLSIVLSVISVISIIITICCFVGYSVDQVFTHNREIIQIENSGDSAECLSYVVRQNNQIFGGIFFIFLIAMIVLAVVIIYLSLPYISNKDKLSPKKSHAYLTLATGIIALINGILSFLTLALDEAPTTWIWVLFGILYVLLAACFALLFVPGLSVKLYQPKAGNKK